MREEFLSFFCDGGWGQKKGLNEECLDRGIWKGRRKTKREERKSKEKEGERERKEEKI